MDQLCGYVWGFHREHYCVEPAGHADDQDAFPCHFCDCDAEQDTRESEQVEA